MAGAGTLPGHAAREARRQGWEVVAFAFGDAPGLAEAADLVVTSRLTEIQAVFEELQQRRYGAALFAGKFWKREAFEHYDAADALGRTMARDGLSDRALAEMVVSVLQGLGLEALDQRRFLAPWLIEARQLAPRAPSEAEWAEIRSGLALARRLAEDGIGQTIVRARGVTVAVEAVEGTDAAIRRGTALAGVGAVVTKAVAARHDYRFDVPAIGPATLRAMRDGGATALGVERGKVLLVDTEETIRLAAEAGIAVVSVEGDG